MLYLIFYFFIAFLTSLFHVIFSNPQIKWQLKEEYYRDSRSYNKLVIVHYKSIATIMMFFECFAFLYLLLDGWSEFSCQG